MGFGIRIFFIDEDDKIIRIPASRFERIRDGSIRCDIYEIFVATVFAFLSVACWVVPTGWKAATQTRQLCCHYNPQIIHSAIT